MRFLLLAVCILFLASYSHSQDTDSLVRTIDSSTNTTQQKYTDPDDSIYQARMNRPVHERGEVLDQFLAGYKEREKEERKQRYIRIGLATVFLAVLAYGIIRRTKQQRKSAGD